MESRRAAHRPCSTSRRPWSAPALNSSARRKTDRRAYGLRIGAPASKLDSKWSSALAVGRSARMRWPRWSASRAPGHEPCRDQQSVGAIGEPESPHPTRTAHARSLPVVPSEAASACFGIDLDVVNAQRAFDGAMIGPVGSNTSATGYAVTAIPIDARLPSASGPPPAAAKIGGMDPPSAARSWVHRPRGRRPLSQACHCRKVRCRFRRRRFAARNVDAVQSRAASFNLASNTHPFSDSSGAIDIINRSRTRGEASDMNMQLILCARQPRIHGERDVVMSQLPLAQFL